MGAGRESSDNIIRMYELVFHWPQYEEFGLLG
jgi:hypothetical protein